VRVQLLKTLNQIDIFSAMTPESLEKMCGVLVDASFERGAYIVEQGDEGDAFYIIVGGEVEVLREENDERGGMSLLATLGPGEYFGERALIKQQLRYANVVARSKMVYTMHITRAGFEAALGPLEAMVPDRYKLDKGEVITALRHVDLLSRLSGPQLSTLCDALNEGGEQIFAEKEWVLEQGDVGDQFYIITSGEAVVMHSSGKQYNPHPLAQLHAWQAFGERSLLRNETRYAGVRATSATLKCLSITRERFEQVLGPLRDLLPDKH